MRLERLAPGDGAQYAKGVISHDEIQAFANQVAERFQPARIILFGSYAYGKPTPDSDVDLLVIMPYRGSGPEAAGRIRTACPRSFPMDLIVRTSKEVERKVRAGDPFLIEVTTKGVILHEAAGSRMGRQGRSRLHGRAFAAKVS
jgi:hypothetical protein